MVWSSPTDGCRHTSSKSSRRDTTRPGTCGEIRQQVEFLAGQRQRLPVQLRAALAHVHPQPADRVHGRLHGTAGPAGPAQHGGDPGVQVRAGERLDHVVVGAGPQQPDHRLLVVAGGGDDDRHVGDAAQHAQRVRAVQVGQAQVEHHQVGRLRGDPAQRVQRRADGVHGVPPVGEGPQHRAAHDVIVFDQQHGGHVRPYSAVASRSRCGGPGERGQAGTTMSFTLFPDTRWRSPGTAWPACRVGDALGSQFFVPGRRPADLAEAAAARALGVDRRHRDGLLGGGRAGRHGRIDRDRLALAFAERCEPHRGYGPGAVMILRLIRTGTPWPVAAASAFDGQGSCGNGAAMRVGAARAPGTPTRPPRRRAGPRLRPR